MYKICIVSELDVVETKNSFHVVSGSAKFFSALSVINVTIVITVLIVIIVKAVNTVIIARRRYF